MKAIIINADDYGRDALMNKAIREAYHDGLISDVSIMTTCPDGYNDLINNNGFEPIGYNGGIHLCLTLGRSLSEMKDSSLVDKNGDFLKKYNKRLFLSRKTKRAIREEFCAQIKALKSIDGFIITHLDSHQHIHFDLALLPIAVSVCREYRIPCMRIPSNSADLSIKSKIGSFLKKWYIKLHGIKVVDFFGSPFQIRGVSNRNYDSYELMCHPWYNSYGEIANKVAIKNADECNLLKNDLASFSESYTMINYSDFIKL